MFNLLPKNLKDAIKSEYKLRRLTLAFLFVVLVEGALLIFLFPTWLISSSKERGIVVQSQAMENASTTTDGNTAITTIKTLNVRLGILNTALEYPALLPLVDKIISQQTNAITIDELVYTSTASSSATIALSGVSSTREALAAFVKDLQDTQAFSNVDLPISNLAKDKNIVFTINLSISQSSK